MTNKNCVSKAIDVTISFLKKEGVTISFVDLMELMTAHYDSLSLLYHYQKRETKPKEDLIVLGLLLMRGSMRIGREHRI